MPSVSINTDGKSKYYYVSFIGSDGRQKRRSTKVPVEGGLFETEMLTKKQAKNRALIEGARIAEAEAQEAEAFNDISVRAFLAEYLERRKAYVSRASFINMRSAYRNLCDVLGRRADAPLRLLKREDAKRFIEARRVEVRASSVRKDVDCISVAFSDAFDSELINRNPFARLTIQPDSRDEKISHEAFTLDEIRMMIRQFPAEWSSAVRCSFETYGQRLGDVLSLTWEQFDFEARVVRLTTGKTGRILEQPMRQGFYEWALTEYTRRQARPKDYVHQTLHKSVNAASVQFGNLLRAFGIGVVSAPAAGKRRQVNSKTFHCIRATCATLIQGSGIAEGIAMKLVGHESEDIHRGYVRPDIELLRQAAESLPGIE